MLLSSPGTGTTKLRRPTCSRVALHRRPLLGCSLCWFIYEYVGSISGLAKRADLSYYSFITYPFGLFSSVIVDSITNSSTKLTTVLAWNLVINACVQRCSVRHRKRDKTDSLPPSVFTSPEALSAPLPSIG